MTVLVVGAAIILGGRVLAAQRAEPPELAGQWELPGGKVEPGESPEGALVRECREELGAEIVLGHRLGGEWPLAVPGYVMWVWTAALAAGAEPAALEHMALRWLTDAELHDIDWIPADLAIVAAIRPYL